MSTALSNYLDNSVSRLAFTLEWYGSRILAQHVDDDKNVMVTFVETREYGCISTISACQSHRILEL